MNKPVSFLGRFKISGQNPAAIAAIRPAETSKAAIAAAFPRKNKISPNFSCDPHSGEAEKISQIPTSEEVAKVAKPPLAPLATPPLVGISEIKNDPHPRELGMVCCTDCDRFRGYDQFCGGKRVVLEKTIWRRCEDYR